jgi:hypothetical protein
VQADCQTACTINPVIVLEVRDDVAPSLVVVDAQSDDEARAQIRIVDEGSQTSHFRSS